MFKNKNYLEYHFIKNGLNRKDIRDEIIEDIISPATPRTSCWWSSLKPTRYGFKKFSSFIEEKHKEYFKNGNYTENKTIATVKQCPAINNIMTNAYLIKSPADISITISNTGGYVFNSSNDLIDIKSHDTDQFYTEDNNLFEGKMNLKFELPIFIRTDDIPFVFLQPMYHNNIWYDVAIGSITERYTKGQPLNINVLVDIPKGESVSYEIVFGEVLAYLWLPEKTKLKHNKRKFYEILYQRKWSSKSRYD
jgi:hypothetical protein